MQNMTSSEDAHNPSINKSSGDLMEDEESDDQFNDFNKERNKTFTGIVDTHRKVHTKSDEFLKEKERHVSAAFGHPSKHQTSSSNNISDLNSALI